MHSLNCKLLYRTKLALSKFSWSGIRHPRVGGRYLKYRDHVDSCGVGPGPGVDISSELSLIFKLYLSRLVFNYNPGPYFLMPAFRE